MVGFPYRFMFQNIDIIISCPLTFWFTLFFVGFGPLYHGVAEMVTNPEDRARPSLQCGPVG